ncbi:MAG: hypothetical protein ACSHX4_10285 [Opitutaceae bacterium]
MSTPKDTKLCPDCGGNLAKIRLLDSTNPTGYHVTLGFASISAKPSMINRKVPRSGDVCGYKCAGCDRIFLYGERAR